MSNPKTTPMVIAEVGCNHCGSFETALELVMVAAHFCKADVVKFQKRHPRSLLSEAEYNAPHPNPSNAYGETYGAHREFLEFTSEEHARLKDACEQWGTTYCTSVWDIVSAREIASLGPRMMKVPSACNLDGELMSYLVDEFGGQLHVSLGMTSRAEEERLVRFLVEKGRGGDTVLYACTSGYPVPFEDVALLEISRLKDSYGSQVHAIGFSGHHLGIAVDIAALALGATWFERHFTLDRTWKGTDHAASLEPDGMRRLCRDLRNVNKSMTPKRSEILDIEMEQRRKLKRALPVEAATGP